MPRLLNSKMRKDTAHGDVKHAMDATCAVKTFVHSDSDFTEMRLRSNRRQ